MHLKFVGLKRHLTAAEMSKTTPTLRRGIFKWRCTERRSELAAFKGLIGSDIFSDWGWMFRLGVKIPVEIDVTYNF